MLQTPLITAVTGTNAHEGVARLRRNIVEILLGMGADPDKEEMYPMAVDAIIRAAVFNHFDILKKFETVMTPEAIKQALNQKPAVNGLTALHDSVLRAATGSANYLEQIRWARGLGAADRRGTRPRYADRARPGLVSRHDRGADDGLGRPESEACSALRFAWGLPRV